MSLRSALFSSDPLTQPVCLTYIERTRFTELHFGTIGVAPFRKTQPFNTIVTVAPLMLINGFSGSGKLTLARILAELLGKEEMILIDNHQLIDPVETKIPREHLDYLKERQLQRSITFTKHVENAAMSSRIVIFTGKMSVTVHTVPSGLAFETSLGRD